MTFGLGAQCDMAGAQSTSCQWSAIDLLSQGPYLWTVLE